MNTLGANKFKLGGEISNMGSVISLKYLPKSVEMVCRLRKCPRVYAKRVISSSMQYVY